MLVIISEPIKDDLHFNTAVISLRAVLHHDVLWRHWHNSFSFLSHLPPTLQCYKVNTRKNSMTWLLIRSCSNWEGQTSLSQILLGISTHCKIQPLEQVLGLPQGLRPVGCICYSCSGSYPQGILVRCPIQRFRGAAAFPRGSPGRSSSSLYLCNPIEEPLLPAFVTLFFRFLPKLLIKDEDRNIDSLVTRQLCQKPELLLYHYRIS